MDFVALMTSKNKSYSVVFWKKTKSFQNIITVAPVQPATIKSSFPYGRKYLSDCTDLSVSTETRHFYVMLKWENTGLSARYILSFVTRFRAVVNECR